MYTVKQVAEHLGVSDNTIRKQWTPEFADFISPTANPKRGVVRQYDENDIAVLETIAALRKKYVSYKDIHKELEAGTRLLHETPKQTQPETSEKQPETGEKQPETALVTKAFADALNTYEKRLTRLEDRLEETTERLIDAEKRAAAAEAEAEILKRPRRWFWQR